MRSIGWLIRQAANAAQSFVIARNRRQLGARTTSMGKSASIVVDVGSRTCRLSGIASDEEAIARIEEQLRSSQSSDRSHQVVQPGIM